MGNQLGKLECTAGFLHQKKKEEKKMTKKLQEQERKVEFRN